MCKDKVCFVEFQILGAQFIALPVLGAATPKMRVRLGCKGQWGGRREEIGERGDPNQFRLAHLIHLPIPTMARGGWHNVCALA